MSATILYKPVGVGTSLDVGAPSSFIEKVKTVFGDFPYTFDKRDIVKLEVLSDLYDIPDNCTPYRELIEQIEKSGVVEVFAMY
jgi:hypothetical protein